MAGEVSKDLTRRMLLPQEIVDVHEASIIHFHDADYYAQHMHNCDLVNLEDMLQNGTVISGTLIENPHSFIHRLQHRNADYRADRLQPVWRPVDHLTHLAPLSTFRRQKSARPSLEEISHPRRRPDERNFQGRRRRVCARRSAAASRPSSIRSSRS